MGALMVRCPTTGLAISTGIDVDGYSFEMLPDVLSHTHCPHCKLKHAWWPREAWLADAARQPPQPAAQARKAL